MLVGKSEFAHLQDGRRLHYRKLVPETSEAVSAATGRPTVVWVSGMGMSGLYFAPLHRRLGRDAGWGAAASVIYDRAGLGRSDDDGGSRTLERFADDLLALLEQLGDDPYVLVGHSWGGPIARVAAARAEGRVVGVLLVDPSDEHLRETLRATPKRAHPAIQRLVKLLATRGMIRVTGQGGFDAAVARELRTQDLARRAGRTHEAELACFDHELDALAAEAPVLDGIPVTLISGTRRPRSTRGRLRRDAMIAAHERTAAANAGMRFVRAERSGHLVTLTEPDLVLRELASLLT